MTYEFATPEPPRLRVHFASGQVEIETAEAGETVVDVDADLDDFTVEQRGRDIVLEQTKKFGGGRSFDSPASVPPTEPSSPQKSHRPISAPVASSAPRGSGRRVAT